MGEKPSQFLLTSYGEEKRALYLATGAKEVWICERDGTVRFFDSSGEIVHSHLIPEFPKVISIHRAVAEERQAGAGKFSRGRNFHRSRERPVIRPGLRLASVDKSGLFPAEEQILSYEHFS